MKCTHCKMTTHDSAHCPFNSTPKRSPGRPRLYNSTDDKAAAKRRWKREHAARKRANNKTLPTSLQ